ncbi:hypothetical protein SNEBB_005836 [Seison nebaliae]|nr:hypothetical protein SNEBB_005836 [Seison nebaliae]
MEERRQYKHNKKCRLSYDGCVPGPVQIIDITQDHKFRVKEAELKAILENPRIRTKKVAIISIAGAFRKGKSFLLDFILRYLNNEGSDNWVGKESDPLTGFHWKGGSDRDTTGILMWSEPFLVKRGSEEIAILLMDTQGAFDSESTVKDCATIFALSLMISSTHVYNIMNNIQEDDLQHLSLFTEYGKLAIEKTSETPFQSLLFLVRDWNYPYEFKFGYNGGKQLLEKRLMIQTNQHQELKDLRKHLRSCFKNINCYLLPHPGLTVATNPDFDGRISDIHPLFVEQVSVLVPTLFTTENLQVKSINGQQLKPRELLEYIKSYCKLFEANDLPEPKSMLKATAEANNLAAKAMAREFYMRAMEQHCGGDKPYMHPSHLQRAHCQLKEKAMSQFTRTKKMGGTSLGNEYFKELENELNELLQNYIKHNQSKNVFSFSRTAYTLIFMMAISYLFGSILDALFLGCFAVMFTFLFWISFILLAVWIYCKYSGEMREVGEYIDFVADIIFSNVMFPLYSNLVQRTIQNMVTGPCCTKEDGKKIN